MPTNAKTGFLIATAALPQLKVTYLMSKTKEIKAETGSRYLLFYDSIET